MCLLGSRSMNEMGENFCSTLSTAPFFHSSALLSQNVLGEAGKGFFITMKAFDRTRPPVSYCMGLMVEHDA